MALAWEQSEEILNANDQGGLEITYGVPICHLRLFKESCSWTMKLHVIDANGSSAESIIGKNPDVHYIYFCIKEFEEKERKLKHMKLINETKANTSNKAKG